ncbi:tRNA (adenosine(37)-N6)-dimethylallyltransferase MiaA [Phragmitibacter flavus]|uniref:tRNA (adenosine(37)-N6)-dimethylallyltransferase MiaA n=1 Tax=Phragmitibacter flavus TaxID=2576071 RepID=UPI00140A5EE9|nr:tRNA (adenosine(37)-N6)-dimethylallyltransferase MiaA [Phragmitibacter flavus]
MSPIYLVGPTASGKSALAIALANHLDGEIVNADAFQLYQGMPICTAQPSASDFAQAPHHLYAVLPAEQTCDAARYADLARPIIQQIQDRGRTPLIVGGSGLYLKALTHGLSDLPSDPTLRETLAAFTTEERVAQLLALDPQSAETVNLRNDRYVSRALEICLLTGQPQSQLRQAWKIQSAPTFTGLILQWPRPGLNDRILQRTRAMISAGLLEEISALPSLSTTAARAIGIREVQSHLRGELTLDETITAIEIATRQYARRQEKWFRRESGFIPLPVDHTHTPDQILQTALAALKLKS